VRFPGDLAGAWFAFFEIKGVETMRFWRLFVLLVVAVTVALAGCSKEETKEPAGEVAGQAAGQMAEKLDPADQTLALTVNGVEITNGQIAEEVARLSRQFGGMDPQQAAQMQGALNQQATENVITRILLQQQVEEEGIEVTQDEIDARMAEIRANLGSEEELSNRLAMMGMTVEMLEDEMWTGLAVEKLINEHAPVAEVTDTDVSAYYDENPGQFQQPERIKASHILIKSDPNDSDAMKKLALEEAESVAAKLREGESFAQLAREYSACPSSQKGGDLGFFQRGQMVKPFEDAAFALDVGEVSGVVETQFGYHIIKVTDREEGRTIPLDEVKGQVKTMLDGRRQQEAMKTYTDQLRASADIQYKN
jgi:peptidyl-prolyl cis-trans isomerase C